MASWNNVRKGFHPSGDEEREMPSAGFKGSAMNGISQTCFTTFFRHAGCHSNKLMDSVL